MKAPSIIEVTVRYRVAKVRRVSPFHWALLRAIRDFPTGNRFAIEELANHLGLDEPFFLNEAWRDLLDLEVVDDPDFQKTKLNLGGDEALKSGCFTLGPVSERSDILYLKRSDGTAVEGELGHSSPGRPVVAPPEWAHQFTSDRLEEVLHVQASPKNELRFGERVLSFQLDWTRASVAVHADTKGERAGEA